MDFGNACMRTSKVRQNGSFTQITEKYLLGTVFNYKRKNLDFTEDKINK